MPLKVGIIATLRVQITYRSFNRFIFPAAPFLMIFLLFSSKKVTFSTNLRVFPHFQWQDLPGLRLHNHQPGCHTH